MKCYASVILILQLLVSFRTAAGRLPRVLPFADEDQGVPIYGDCEFLVNGDLNDPAPLFSRHASYEIVVPDPTDTVRLTNGELLDMFCPGVGFAAPFANRTQVTAQCLQQKYFLVDGQIHPFSDFSCTAWPTYTALRTGRQCNGGTDLVKAGFEVEDGGFLHTFDVCHDEVNEVTRYVHHVLYPSSYDYQHGVSRPSFIELDFYGGRDVNTKYTQVQQNITISGILGLDASPYFNYTEDRILARGHMVAKTDMIFGAAHQATFLFINVAPQWQSFNGGNWERVESSVRKFVADRNLTTDCYTGIYGVSTLPDVNGTERELYLDFDENNNGLIPVPMLYFRVIIDRATREGIVLIGVNNPYVTLEQIQEDYILCEDVGHRISWITWLKEDLHEGYSYACTVEDFTAVVKDLPLEDLQTNGVLGLDPETTTAAPTTTESSTTESTTTESTTTESTTTESTTTESTTTESTTEPTTESTSSTTVTPTTTETTPKTTTESSTSSSTTSAAPTPTPTPNPNDCHFNINGNLRDPAPLFTPEGALSWLLPDESGVYTIEQGGSLDLHCTSALAVPFNRYTALTARCLGNQLYEAEGEQVAIRSFSCQSWPTYEAVRTGVACEGGTELLQIGFNVAAGLLPQIELCYDEQTQITRYARYELTPSNVAYQRDVAQPGYLRGDFYQGKDVNVFYGLAHQQTALSQLLGLDASQYLDSSRDLYLARGQLAARQDFVHGSAQRATHFYVNAVPQWRSIGIGNWLAVERSLRQFVADEALNVSVHAGSWGISTLANAAGQQTPIYLDAEAEQLPVPRIVYRVVIDQQSRKGIVLVVVNNPHATLAEIQQDYVVCQDVGTQLDWLDWQKTQLQQGYSYACSVEDFTAVVKDLPLDQLKTTGLLGVSADTQEQQQQQACSFRVSGDLNDPAPVFVLRTAEGKAEYLEPNIAGLAELKHGEQLELHCTGSSTFKDYFKGYSRLNASCWGAKSFLVLGSVYQLEDFVCSSWPGHTARRTTRECNGGTNLLEVGFQLAETGEADDFLHMYDVCHDEELEVTRYVHHVLLPGSAMYQRSVSRPSFITGDFYGVKDVNQKYTQVQQNVTVSQILGMDASPYFNISSNVYLARGHLAAKTDLVFGAAQQATFYFVNVAPQWQTFNGGNWERIEDSVRKFVADENITADCYTGTWGVSTLPDVDGIERELYLDFDENNNGLIPVPMLYFRVIIDRESRQGIVVLGVNNPHVTVEQIQNDYVICPDIGDQIDWISWNKETLNRGYSYACTVEEFTKVVTHLPLENLATSGVLGVIARHS